ncbi:MAG TPA: hypothetical protein VFM88_16370 [Vicinamibacteria bacterium]|nr:hypothetical protein [Vicinamibacteria bacterium]
MSVVSTFALWAAIWGAAGVVLAWGLLPGRWRLAIALTLSVAGLVFLVLATNTEGFRETQSTTVFLVGPPQVTGLASASAALPYYVLTAFCLLLGTLGVVASDAAAHLIARRFLAWAVAVSLLVILVRFLLEKAAAPPAWTYVFGVSWLPPVVGAWFYLRGRDSGASLGRLSLRLLGYALVVRGVVAAFYVAATRLRFGSHFDLSSVTQAEGPWGRVHHFEPGSLTQLMSLAIVPQLVVWPLFTLVAGLLGAGMAAVILRAASKAPPLEA